MRGLDQLVFYILMIFFLSVPFFNACSDYEAQTTRTNVNEKTDFFETKVDDAKALEEMIQNHKNIYGVERNGTRGIEEMVDINVVKDSEEIQNLKAINEHDLESEGNRKYLTKEGRELMEMHINFSDPLLQQDKLDIEKIADNTSENLGNLLNDLRKIGIDCKEEGGHTLADPLFTSVVERKEHSNTNYDKTLCEELKNKYKCQKHLKVKCEKETQNIVAINNLVAIPYIQKKYDLQSGYLHIGTLFANQHRYGSEKGKVYNYDISFNIENLEDINMFQLEEIYFNEQVKISVNGNDVFIRPYFGDKQELVVSDYEKYLDTPGKQINQLQHKFPAINIRKYLVPGGNNIHIKLIIGNRGDLLVRFLVKSFKHCNKWQETWEETCIYDG